MFVLDAKCVLTRHDVAFSDRNMKRQNAGSGSDEAFFQSIPFASVFHEGGIGGDYSIIEHRCAVVLPISPLPLQDVLSEFDFDPSPNATSLHKLGPAARQWRDICSVSDELKVFDKRFPFLADISLSTEGVRFRLNHRHDLGEVAVSIQVINSQNEICVNFKNDAHATFNNSQGR